MFFIIGYSTLTPAFEYSDPHHVRTLSFQSSVITSTFSPYNLLYLWVLFNFSIQFGIDPLATAKKNAENMNRAEDQLFH